MLFSMPRFFSHLPFALASLAVLPLAVPPAHAQRSLNAVELSAERTVLRADGRSTTVVSARVFDTSGNLVPDGTRVRFTTTAGRLDASVATTRGGVARVSLTSSDQPGDALIVAVLEAAGQATPARLTVTFSRDADNGDTGVAWIRVSGAAYTGYAADLQTIQASGSPRADRAGAQIVYRGLTLVADTLQLNLRENEIVATGRVNVTVEGNTFTYSALKFNLVQGQGVAERLDEGRPRPITVAGGGKRWEEIAWEEGRLPPAPGTFQFQDLSGSRLTVVSRSIQVEPGRRLQFRRATFYFDGTKTASLPFHIMNLDQATLFNDQIVGVGPQGLQVDFPLYYDVRPEGVGTLHLRRGARVGDGAFATRTGWSFDVEQAYNGRQGASGVVEINGLSRRDWGTRLRHAQQLGRGTTASAFVDFPNHRTLFATTQIARSFKTFTLNASNGFSRSPGYADVLTGTQSAASSDFRTQLLGETYDRQTFGIPSLRYVLSASVGRQFYFGARQAGQSRGVTSEFAGTRLFTTPLTIARAMTATQSVSLGQTWLQGTSGTSAGRSGLSIQGTTSLNREIPRFGMLGVSYDFTQTPLLSGVNAAAFSGRHRIGATAYLAQGDGWGITFNGSRALDAPQSTLFASGQFRIAGPWRGRISLSTSDIAGIAYREVEYALIRRIADRDIAVYYSTTSQRFQLDLSGARF